MSEHCPGDDVRLDARVSEAPGTVTDEVPSAIFETSGEPLEEIDFTNTVVNYDSNDVLLNKYCATEYNVSGGHSLYQSIVVQDISDGNIRQWLRKSLPIGDIASTTCRLERTRDRKNS